MPWSTRMHDEGIIHRDLKPANLMIDHEGRTVVMDFGIARVLAKDRQTRAGTLVGTLEYIAPEIVRGEDADARSDLYALGCVLYEMVTGELPFQGASDFALMRAHAEQAPPPPRDRARELPAGLEAVILRALAKRPGKRFPDAQSFRAALQAALGAPPPTTRLGAGLDLAPALRRLAGAAARAIAWLELPRSADRGAWALWLRANPGLAGVMLVAAGALCTAVAWTALSWRPPAMPAGTSPIARVVQPPAPGGPMPVVLRPTQDAGAAAIAPAPEQVSRESGPRSAAPVFEMPPPPRPRVSVERATSPAPRDTGARTVVAPSPPPEPGPSAAAPKNGGWYVKH
jgi:hypothetical protein